jgi:hypothetical protein
MVDAPDPETPVGAGPAGRWAARRRRPASAAKARAPATRRPACRGAVFAGLLSLAWLGGCTAPSSTGAGPVAAPGLPPGAIQVGPELYQVPIGADARGCQMYRLYSPSLTVAEAISYRSREGGFTIDRRAAACGPGAAIGGAPGVRA